MDFISSTCYDFLNVYWLRAESAIHRILDVIEIQKIPFKKPILDLGCGNIFFSFLKCGGKFDIDFDFYKWVSDTSKFHTGRDIYNKTSSFRPRILKKPNTIIDCGIDWKQNLLNNSKQLGIYEKVKKHDLNKPLPFRDNTFQTIFSNDIFWVEKIDSLLRECKRIIKPGGSIILFVPDSKFKQNLIYSEFLKNRKNSWAKVLDRGNYPNMKHCYTLKQWKSKFSRASLKTVYHNSYLSEELIRYSQIGLKVYSPYLIEMANILQPTIRRKIKKRLIQEILPIIKSYILNYEGNISKNQQFHTFVLKG